MIEPASIDILLAEHEGALLRYAAGFLNDHALAQDAVQEAFVALIRQSPQPSGDYLRHWLFTVVRNKSLDLLRKEKRRAWLHFKFSREPRLESRSSEREKEDPRIRALAAALPKLNPARREVLLLRLQQGLPHEQIATITGRTPGHCRKLLHEAVTQLKLLVKINEL